MRLALVPIALLIVAACRSASTRDQPRVPSAPPVAAPVVQESASIPVNRYDDAFGTYTADCVNVAVTSATAYQLEFEVSALKRSGGKLRAPESGVSVAFSLLRTGAMATVRVRSRWWSDRATEGKPSAGELDAVTADVILSPSSDSLGVRFRVPGAWTEYREVRGEISLPHDSIAAFLDAWNAARAAQER